MSYTFRLRFLISDKVKFPFEEKEVKLFEADKIKIKLATPEPNKTIKTSDQLVVKGEGYESAEAANIAGQNIRDRLTIAFSKLRFPADFGDRAAKGLYTEAGLKMLEKEAGQPVLNNIHGLLVHESNAEYRYATFKLKGTIHKSAEESLKIIASSFSIKVPITEKRRLAYELFSASSFTDYVDARFMLLMMAVETLIEQKERDAKERELIEQMISLVEKSEIENKQSLKSSLSNLKYESIGQAGRNIASNLKGTYLDVDPIKFFMKCYELRSKLVHGQVPRPTFEEVGNYCGALEVFTSELISFPDM